MADVQRALREPERGYVAFQLWLNAFLRRDNSFSQYQKDIIKTTGIDLTKMVLDHAAANEKTTFYDIGCGNGNAYRGLTDALAQRADESGIDRMVLDSIVYVGIDLDVAEVREKGRILTRADIHDPKALQGLPDINVGVCYWSFPYFDDKVAAIANLTKKLDGMLIILPYFHWQIEGCGREWLPESRNNALTLTGQVEMPDVRLRDSVELGHLYYGAAKGEHFGQRISRYSHNRGR